MAKGGADDLFSSDFDDAELVARLQHMSTAGQNDLLLHARDTDEHIATSGAGSGAGASEVAALPHRGLHTLVAFSMADEYVLEHLDRPKHVRRLVAGMQSKEIGTENVGERSNVVSLELKGANHNLSAPPEAASTFVAAVGELLTNAMGGK